jgi:hypothetical protein
MIASGTARSQLVGVRLVERLVGTAESQRSGSGGSRGDPHRFPVVPKTI